MQIFGAESCKYLLFLSQCSAHVLLACESDCPQGERNQQTYRNSCCHSITYPSVGFGQMEAFGSDEDVADADHRHEQRWNEGNQVAVFAAIPIEPNDASPEGEHGEARLHAFTMRGGA